MHKRKLSQSCDKPEVLNIKKKRTKDNIEQCLNQTNKLSGTISHIVLQNFMCHNHLEIRFEKNINYLTGSNGSGKSAILNSLIIGLGAKANVTKRCQNLKGFIKAGENYATISIYLNNVGHNAYKPNLYGDKICIQRQINTSSGNYKIKSATGSVISTHCKTVKQILSHMNIHVNNPICILTQDTARTFLSEANPKKLFDFFWKATRLEDCYENYQKISNTKHNIQELLEEKTQTLKRRKHEIEALQTQIRDAQILTNLKTLLVQLDTELAWAKVHKAEELYKLIENKKDCIEMEYYNLKKSNEGFERKKNAIEIDISKTNRMISELNTEHEENNNKLMTKQQELEEINCKYNTKKNKKLELERLINDFKRHQKTLQTGITNYNIELEIYEMAKRKRNEKLTSLQQEQKSVRQQKNTIQSEQFQLKQNLELHGEKYKTFQRELHDLNRSSEKIRENLSNLKNKNFNELNLYGRNMSNLVNTIKACQHKFKKLPVGPIGLHVKLKDNKWAVAIEGYFGSNILKSFCVDNSEDLKQLSHLMKQIYGNEPLPDIIVTKFLSNVHNVSRNKVLPTSGCIPMFDALNVSNVIVLNYLIDSKKIEKVLLIPDTTTATRIMSAAENVPPKCILGITIKCDTFYPFPRYKKFGSRYHVAKYLQGDNNVMIRHLEMEMEGITRQKPNIESQISDLQSEVSNIQQNLAQLSKKSNRLHEREKQIQDEVIKIDLEPLPEMGSVEMLKSEFDDLKEKIDTFQLKLSTIEEHIDKTNIALEKSKEELNSWELICNKMFNRIKLLEEQILIKTTNMNDLILNLTYENIRLEDIVLQLEEHKQTLLAKEMELNAIKETAKSYGNEVEIKRTYEEILSEINKTQKQIGNLESKTSDISHLQETFNTKEINYETNFEVFQKLQKAVKQYCDLVNRQKKQLKHQERVYCQEVESAFETVLEYRNFKGHLEIDLNMKTINISVMPHKGPQELTKTINLSGGERSFTTVAFLYSLWQCTQLPFYFLDEFDVFMDKENRRRTMDVLIQHAKERSDAQFVFLTPQDMSFLSDDDDIMIHRLKGPRGK